MIRKFIPTLGALAALACLGLAQAGTITDADTVVLLGANLTGSGNGTLDFMMYTKGTNENKLSNIGVNWDDANTDVPTGDGSTDGGTYDEYFITSFGDLQEFYKVNFGITGPGQVTLVIFLDLDEAQTFDSDNLMNILDLWLDPTMVAGQDPTVAGSTYDAAGGDVDNADQNKIADATTAFTGGTLLASLDPVLFTNNLPEINNGGGFADYAFITDIDPFAYDPKQLLLFRQSISLLSNGAETKFLSGTVSSIDLCAAIPRPTNCIDPDPIPMSEPSTLALLGTGMLGFFILVGRRSRATVIATRRHRA